MVSILEFPLWKQMAAGLIPVVTSYGGCSEKVPKEYQYTDIKDAYDCISKNIEQ